MTQQLLELIALLQLLVASLQAMMTPISTVSQEPTLGQVVDTSLCTLTLVDKLPTNKFITEWKLPNNSVVTTEMTEADYRALALAGARAPKNTTGNKNAVWIKSYEIYQYDTPTGNLEDCMYAEVGSFIKINFPFVEGVKTISGIYKVAGSMNFENDRVPVRIINNKVYAK